MIQEAGPKASDTAAVLKRIQHLRSAVDDATFELYCGGLTLLQGEALARDISTVKEQIAGLERSLQKGVTA